MSKIIIALLIAFSTMASVVYAQENEIQNKLIEPQQQIVTVPDMWEDSPIVIEAANTSLDDPIGPPLPKELVEPPPIIEYGKYTPDQIKLLILARKVGGEYGHAEATQAILLQESAAGLGGRVGGFNLPILKRCYGIMQMKVSAVLDVLRTYPELISKYFNVGDLAQISVKEVIKKLKSDDEFAIRMSVNYYKEYYTGNLVKAIMTYNQGPAGVLRFRHPERHPYMKGIMKHLAVIKDFNHYVDNVMKGYMVANVEGDIK